MEKDIVQENSSSGELESFEVRDQGRETSQTRETVLKEKGQSLGELSSSTKSDSGILLVI